MEVIRRDSDRLEPVIDPAIKALETLFRTIDPTEAEIMSAHMAKSILATWAKLKQSERAQDAMYFALARELSDNKEQLAKYIEVSLPGSPFKALESGKKD